MSQNTAGTQLLLNDEKNRFSLRIETDATGLTCLASIRSDTPEEVITPEEFLKILHRLDIRNHVDGSAVEDFCHRAGQGQWPVDVQVAKGKAPAKGQNGFLELYDLASRCNTTPDHESEGAVDLRTVQVFDNVDPGQEIGRIVPPEQGEAGETVQGKAIPGLLGKDAGIKLGKGVKIDEKTGLLYATLSGRIVNEPPSLSVSEIYEVNGAVDYSIGSIHFNGEVRIHGDVLDGFTIYATGDITVDGIVGNCHLTSKGNIQLGSFNGQGEGLLRCDGNLKARYLNDMTAEVNGDVFVENEIRNSVVKARGTVRSPNGTIVGGETIALQGIEAQEFGGASGARTRLISGVDFSALDRQRFLFDRRRTISGEIQHILNLIGNIKERLPENETDPPNIQRLLDRYEALGNTREVVDAELENYRGFVAEAANPKINVGQMLYEGVTITLGAKPQRIKRHQPGSSSIVASPEDGSLFFPPLSSLEISAEECLPEEGPEDEDPAA